MRWLVPAIATSVASLCLAGSARADGLTKAEAQLLRAGTTVTRPETVIGAGRRYVGGITYTIVDAREGEVAALLDDVAGWRRFLPQTRNARKVGAANGDSLIEVTHGSALLQVTYTIRVHRDGSGVRFWLDPVRAHDIDLFEDRVRGAALTVPDRVRGLLLERRAGEYRDSLVAGAGLRY